MILLANTDMMHQSQKTQRDNQSKQYYICNFNALDICSVIIIVTISGGNNTIQYLLKH